jgi:hypothetical protein
MSGRSSGGWRPGSELLGGGEKEGRTAGATGRRRTPGCQLRRWQASRWLAPRAGAGRANCVRLTKRASEAPALGEARREC